MNRKHIKNKFKTFLKKKRKHKKHGEKNYRAY